MQRPSPPAPPVEQVSDMLFRFDDVSPVRLALLPTGEFDMGASPMDGEAAMRTDTPHHVKITIPFYISRYEITLGQFRTFVEISNYQPAGLYNYYDSGAKEIFEDRLLHPGEILPDQLELMHAYDNEQSHRYNWSNTGFTQSDDMPVVNVSWNDAMAFCEWMSNREGRKVRLPTEAEWEYACRAGTTTTHAFGNTRTLLAQRANMQDMTLSPFLPRKFRVYNRGSWKWRDGFPFTAPVGSFPPNAFGLYDMHGNVSEWCQDWYADDYYKVSPEEDPPGPAQGDWRVVRGGEWATDYEGSISSTRGFCTQREGRISIGFRIVCEVENKQTDGHDIIDVNTDELQNAE